MVVDNDRTTHVVSDRRRHLTIAGIFVFVGLALALLHNSVNIYGVRFSVSPGTRTSSESKQQVLPSLTSLSYDQVPFR